MDDTLNGFRQFKIDNIHNEKETNHTASTLYGYINMPMVNTIYGYQDSELNHMMHPVLKFNNAIHDSTLS